jgi:NAD(P)-dependent dehydrogenase (short-subunit alcohol dehydrogenase family)
VGVAVVTGGGSGIGAATALALARDGYGIRLADLDSAAAERSALAVRAAGGEADPLTVDVAEPASVATAFAAIGEPIDVLVNAAGIIVVEAFADFTAEQWERTYRVNVVGTYLCLQAALPALRAAEPPARVINVASAAGKMAGPFTAPYNASKAAVINLTRSAAVALAPGILVNAVCPGVIDTPMWRRDLGPGLVRAGSGTTFEARTASLPIGRPGTAEEVAATIAFMASPGNAYMLGEDVNVNGGLALW